MSPGTADIVINRFAKNQIWAYYNVTDSISCRPLLGSGDLSVRELTGALSYTVRNGGVEINVPRRTTVSIYDISGRLVLRRTVDGHTFIPLPRGMYVLKEGRSIRILMVQ